MRGIRRVDSDYSAGVKRGRLRMTPVLNVPIEQAENGMVVATPVFHPEAPEHVLLRAGFPLDRPVLERLKAMGVKRVWVKYPSLASIEKQLSPELLRRRAELAGKIRNAFELMQNEATAEMNYESYRSSLTELIQYLLSHPASLICMDEMSGGHTPLMEHSLRVSYMSVLMGLKLDAYLVNQRRRLDPRRARQINSLGLGAMLHDIGLVECDTQLVNDYLYDPRRDVEGNPDWQHHVRLGYDKLYHRLEPTARAIILHHHQHHDGSGFPKHRTLPTDKPRGREGDTIHIFSRIVCVADVYNRLRHNPDGGSIEPVEALGKMFQPPLIDWFDAVVLQTFLRITPPYPPGTLVILNDGCRAAVIEHHPEHPCRPTVQLLDSTAQQQESQGVTVLDLREHPKLHVVEAGGQNVEAFNFDLPNPESPYAHSFA